MTASSWIQLAALLVALALGTWLLGTYLARVFGDGRAPGDPIFLPVERLIYRFSGVDPSSEQRWTVYALSVLAFSLVSILVVYLVQRTQAWLPLNPNGADNVPAPLAFNTAVSFVTNTNWQNYGGESTMGYLAQAGVLAVQNFVSAAVGLSVAIALIRGLVRARSTTIGNFWVDLTRGTVRVLLPLSLVAALVFVSQGVVQNVNATSAVTTVEGANQIVPGGMMASQEAIKELGTNGGGYVNANAAHPFENPNGLTNWFQILLILLIPFALTYTFGKLAKNQRMGWVVFAAMFVLWAGSAIVAVGYESAGNPMTAQVGADQSVTAEQGGGNTEGKEVRFGPTGSGLYAASTTGTSTGSVNSMHDSYTPLGGAAPLVNIMLGEVSPGGVGAGLYGMLVFVLLAVFIAGLMVGRTPELLGKKIQAAEMKLVVIYILAVPLVVLGFAAASIILPAAVTSLLNPGPHGLTEMTYAFASAGNNNGSAFGGLTGNTDWFNTTLGISMLVGRFVLIVATLAIAGSLVRKQPVPASAGTFPTDTPLFTGLLLGVVIIVVGLTYFPVLALGPIVEQLGI
jgi:potassium-transporting ATPase potassium-binding subunit